MDSMSSNKVEHLPIKVDSQKGQERAEKCISIVNAKVYKAMQTWAKMAKDANAQAEHVDKDIKAIIPWIEVIEKRKGTLVYKIYKNLVTNIGALDIPFASV